MKNLVKKLLKEDLGVSRATIPFANLIMSKLDLELERFFDTEKSFNKKVIIELKEIKPIYRKDFLDFIEFPVEEIHMNLNFVYKKRSETGQFSSGGGAYEIGNKKNSLSYLKKPNKSIPLKVLEEVDKTLIATFDFDIIVYGDFFTYEEARDKVYFDLRETVFHELNHMYEFYMRRRSKVKSVDPVLSYAGGKNVNIPKSIFKFWSSTFLNYVYFSEPYEINAMSQEMYAFRLRAPIEEMMEHRYWIAATKMENFDAENYYQELVSVIENYNPEYVDSVIDRLFKFFIKDYKKEAEILDPYIINSKDLLDLLKRFQLRINKAGRKLKRNFGRLYAIETN